MVAQALLTVVVGVCRERDSLFHVCEVRSRESPARSQVPDHNLNIPQFLQLGPVPQEFPKPPLKQYHQTRNEHPNPGVSGGYLVQTTAGTNLQCFFPLVPWCRKMFSE